MFPIKKPKGHIKKTPKGDLFLFLFKYSPINRKDSFIKENMWEAFIKHTDPNQVSATAGCSLSLDSSTAYLSPEDRKI